MCNQQAGGGQHTVIKSDIGEPHASTFLQMLDELTIILAQFSLHLDHVLVLRF